MKIAMLQPVRKFSGKMAVFCKSYKNTLIGVFLHEEFISELKTEPKPTVFKKYAKNRRKIFVIIIFYIFVIFSISFKQNFLKPNESCFFHGKKPNIAKLLYIIFLVDTMKIAMLYIACSKILGKMAASCKSYKNTLIRVFFHAKFIYALKTETKSYGF